MNRTISFGIIAIVLAVGLLAAATVSAVDLVQAQGGPKGEKNFGQCKQDFNEKPCKKHHTGSR